ncbi:MAG: choline-sulfatase, partial [Verrucomicrobiales bacterium]
MKATTALTLILSALTLTVSAAERPNFLFIIADDQSPFDLKVYDPESKLDTPNIDRLAKGG